MEVRGARLTKEVIRVLLGVQGGDGGGRVVPPWNFIKVEKANALLFEREWNPTIFNGFQENSNDEADERTSEEYLRSLDIEFHERALLANSKLKRGFQPKFTPKFIQSTQHAQNIPGGETKVQKDYKAEYKKMKAKLALLEASPPTS
ncbi:hypothetical protein Tco_0662650 [Tanacetum coccineum]